MPAVFQLFSSHHQQLVYLVLSSAMASLISPTPGLSHYFGNSDLQTGIWLQLMEYEDLIGHPKRQGFVVGKTAVKSSSCISPGEPGSSKQKASKEVVWQSKTWFQNPWTSVELVCSFSFLHFPWTIKLIHLVCCFHHSH